MPDDIETPEADLVEQQQTVEEPHAPIPTDHDAPLEVDEGDLAESSLEVPLDEDDWR